MYLEFLKPEVFDVIIVANIVIGLLIAARRFRKDITGPLPEDAPASARDSYESTLSPSSSDS
ncbi:MAG: hypothetical protein OXG53_12950 [Chloroflexi bacterium]|nr:hypothetical protein [Chloroflexota bacterium]